jgi:hypothetical protein
MFLMPDIGPSNYLFSRIATITFDPWHKYRDKISIAMGQALDWKSASSYIADIISEVVTYDMAIFGVLSEDASEFRITTVVPPLVDRWPRRWGSVPADRLKRLTEGAIIEANWLEMLENYPEFASDDTIQLLRANGVRSTISLPIGAPTQPSAVLTLASRKENAFNDDSLTRVRALGLRRQLWVVLRMMQREHAASKTRIGASIVASSSIGIAVDALLSGLVDEFQWEYVGFYSVDSDNKTIHLLSQHCVNDESKRGPFSKNVAPSIPDCSAFAC